MDQRTALLPQQTSLVIRCLLSCVCRRKQASDSVWNVRIFSAEATLSLFMEIIWIIQCLDHVDSTCYCGSRLNKNGNETKKNCLIEHIIVLYYNVHSTKLFDSLSNSITMLAVTKKLSAR
jgi:hypothetical protein